MQQVLDDLSIAPLLRAMEANVHEAWIRLGHGLDAVVYEESELLWFLSGLPVHFANGIVRTQFLPDMEEEAYEERLKRLTAHHNSLVSRAIHRSHGPGKPSREARLDA